VSWKYELLYVPPGSAIALTVQGPNSTSTFTFAQPDVEGSYRLRLTVTDAGGASDVDIRNLVVPFPNGTIAPPYQANPAPCPLVGAGAKPNEMNLGNQAFGWDGKHIGPLMMYQVLKLFDQGWPFFINDGPIGIYHLETQKARRESLVDFCLDSGLPIDPESLGSFGLQFAVASRRVCRGVRFAMPGAGLDCHAFLWDGTTQIATVTHTVASGEENTVIEVNWPATHTLVPNHVYSISLFDASGMNTPVSSFPFAGNMALPCFFAGLWVISTRRRDAFDLSTGSLLPIANSTVTTHLLYPVEPVLD